MKKTFALLLALIMVLSFVPMAWAYYAATQYILGIRPDFDGLVIDPCIPGDWKEFSVTRMWRGSRYEIHVSNPDGTEKGVRCILAEGKKVQKLPLLPEGSICHAEVVMGQERREEK